MKTTMSEFAQAILEDKWVLCSVTEALEYAIDEHLTDRTYLIYDEAGDSRPATDVEVLVAVLEILQALNAGQIDDRPY